MRPTEPWRDWSRLAFGIEQRIEATISIGLEHAGKVGQMPGWMGEPNPVGSPDVIQNEDLL